MMEDKATPPRVDLTRGFPFEALVEGSTLVGYVGEEKVLVVRRRQEIFAVGALCSHYHSSLADGLVVGATVRCPLHHASFDLRTGEALCAPAFRPIDCWSVERRGDQVFVCEKRKRSVPRDHGTTPWPAPQRVVIVGGGAAGFAAAEMMRRQQYGGELIMLSNEGERPIDRPNLSKDYLAGNAPDQWMSMQRERFYSENAIDLRLGADVVGIDTRSRQVTLAGGEAIAYDRLLLATGAEPVRLAISGADEPHVHTLRTLADARAICERAEKSRCAVVIGASFIGLEVAASLRARAIEVHVIAPDKRPMERVLGPQFGDVVRALHEQHGVVFHLEDMPTAIDHRQVRLKSGRVLDADIVIVGIGVRPRLDLADKAGLAVDRGVVVDAHLQTSVPGVFAAGDVARWPDRHSRQSLRVEHWVVAQRQGQVAALNMLGWRQKFVAVPFFWSQHYDVAINYVGHAEKWDELVIDGDIAAKDCLVHYKLGGRTLAVASISRDMANLQAELAMELEGDT